MLLNFKLTESFYNSDSIKNASCTHYLCLLDNYKYSAGDDTFKFYFILCEREVIRTHITLS